MEVWGSSSSPRRMRINSIFLVSPTPFRTVPSDEVATMSHPSTLDAPCSSASTTSSRVSPESHSSTVQTLGRSDWSLSIVMGRISRMLLVRKFWIPFLVGESSFLSAGLPEVAMIEPAVRNLYRGPRARVIAVAIGDMTSSASFIVGAVVI